MTKQYARLRAVKNILCRLEDEISMLYIQNKMPDVYKIKLIGINCEIDKCVESLEKALLTTKK